MRKLVGLALVASFIAFSEVAAQDAPVVDRIDPEQELSEQIAKVQEGRNIIRDFNEAGDLAGTSFFCRPKQGSSGEYEVYGSSYPSDAKVKTDIKDLKTPQLRQRILEKGGSISGWGGEISAGKKHLIQTGVSELVRLRVDESSASNLGPIVKKMRAAGAKDDDSFCYIWSVTAYKAEVLVNDEKKLSIKTPGTFVVVGNASFLKSDKLVDSTFFATYLASRYVVKAVEDQLEETRGPDAPEITPAEADVRSLMLPASILSSM